MPAALLLCRDQDLARRFQSMLPPGTRVVQWIDHPVAAPEMTRLILLHAPDVVFVGIESVSQAGEIASHVHSASAHTPVVGITRHDSTRLEPALEQVGFAGCLSIPCASLELEDLVTALAKGAGQRVTPAEPDVLFSFLPAKGGVGSTLLAVHLAQALARFPDCRVLLADLDTANPAVHRLLPPGHLLGLRDALACLPIEDPLVWKQFLGRHQALDVLGAGHPAGANPRFTPTNLMQLLSFARRAYHAVCLDLGPALATPALSALRDSRTIFLTTSCDAVSLQMAHERKHLLTQMGVGDRVAVLVTRRNEEKAPGASEIESYMGSPVCGVFDLRETGVQRSIEQSGRIPWSSSAGKNVERLAAWIAVHTVAGSLATVAR